MPDNVQRVKRYRDDIPLFSRFQIEHQIETAYSRTVTLPSGGATPVTFPNGPAQVATAADVKYDAANRGMIGHNQALQTATRLATDTIDNYGRYRTKGTAVPAREDFNTLDNPFSWYVDTGGVVRTPTARGVG